MGETHELSMVCNRCGGRVSFAPEYQGATVSCPHCGGGLFLFQATPSVVKPASPISLTSGNSSKSQKSSVVGKVTSVILTVIATAIFLRIFSPDIYGDWKNIIVGRDGNQPYRDAVDSYLKSHANDPGSLSYQGWKVSKQGEALTRVEVEYRAKNGFGALMLYHGSFYFDNDGKMTEAYPDKAD